MSPTPTAGDAELRRSLALACRVLFCQGHEHFHLGHVSALTDEGIWVKPTGLGLEEVTAADIVLTDRNGQLLKGERRLHTEMPIHTEAYRARPDIRAVVHTHAFHAGALAASGARFELVSQDSLSFATGMGFYPRAELVESTETGQALAAALGARNAVIMRNHGMTVVGSSVEQAAVRAVELERSCRTQLAATQLGGVRSIAPEEVERMRARFDDGGRREQQIWRYLVRDAERRLGPGGG